MPDIRPADINPCCANCRNSICEFDHGGNKVLAFCDVDGITVLVGEIHHSFLVPSLDYFRVCDQHEPFLTIMTAEEFDHV